MLFLALLSGIFYRCLFLKNTRRGKKINKTNNYGYEKKLLTNPLQQGIIGTTDF